MYYPYFLFYILIGVSIGLVVFIWALRNGQFSDQQRARFLALEDDPPVAVKSSGKGGFEIYTLFFLAVAGIVSSFAIIAYALLSR
ncbi:MAG: cbb3-type cytochrome oxidase assembly protein CcoS [bacterium]|nr:cbb3-type cytochrome oxidase assembly protein CcoS [bacterium]